VLDVSREDFIGQLASATDDLDIGLVVSNAGTGNPIEVLAADGKHEVLEGDPIEGMVIVKFPSVKAAKDWINSEAYQDIAKHRKLGATYHGLIVEGLI